MVVEIGNREVLVGWVQGNAKAATKLGESGWLTVSGKTLLTRTRELRDCARLGIELANAIVPGVREINRSLPCHGKAVHTVECCLSSGAAISIVPKDTFRSGQSDELSFGGDRPESFTLHHLDDVNCPIHREIDTKRLNEFCLRSVRPIRSFPSSGNENKFVRPS